MPLLIKKKKLHKGDILVLCYIDYRTEEDAPFDYIPSCSIYLSKYLETKSVSEWDEKNLRFKPTTRTLLKTVDMAGLNICLGESGGIYTEHFISGDDGSTMWAYASPKTMVGVVYGKIDFEDVYGTRQLLRRIWGRYNSVFLDRMKDALHESDYDMFDGGMYV